MTTPSKEILKKIDELFPPGDRSSVDKMLQVFSDAAEVCKRPFWTASAESRVEYGKVLPEVFDKETAMWLRALATAVIWNKSSFLMKGLTDNDESPKRGKDKSRKIQTFKKVRASYEEYSQRTVLTVDPALGKVNQTLDMGYKIPFTDSTLITFIRQKGEFPNRSDMSEVHLEGVWDKERRTWDQHIKRDSSVATPVEKDMWAFKTAVYSAWVFYIETKLHMAEMAIIAHQILASSADKKVKDTAKQLLEPADHSFKSAKEAKEWMDRFTNEIVELKKLMQ